MTDDGHQHSPPSSHPEDSSRDELLGREQGEGQREVEPSLELPNARSTRRPLRPLEWKTILLLGALSAVLYLVLVGVMAHVEASEMARIPDDPFDFGLREREVQQQVGCLWLVAFPVPLVFSCVLSLVLVRDRRLVHLLLTIFASAGVSVALGALVAAWKLLGSVLMTIVLAMVAALVFIRQRRLSRRVSP